MVGGPELTRSTARDRYDGHVRVRWIFALIVSALAILGVGAPATQAATSDDLSITIRSISPTILTGKSTITLTGTVTNSGKQAWTSANAYLVMPRWPYTSREQVHDVLSSDYAYVGERIVSTGRFAELGTLQPGQTKQFSIRVPSGDLDLSAADGVYPVGVHLVATDPQGARSGQSKARDLTLLPRLSDDARRVQAGIIWPFIEPWSPATVKRDEIAESVMRGPLRHYLDAAAATPHDARTILIDPALLDSVSAVSDEAEELKLTAEEVALVDDWIADTLALASASDTYIIDYGRPDYFGFLGSPQSKNLNSSVQSATRDAIERYKLVGKSIVWPAAGDPTSKFVSHLVALDHDLAVVSSERVSSWKPTAGSRVPVGAVDSKIEGFVHTPWAFSPLTSNGSLVVQNFFSTATFSSLEKSQNSSAHSDALLLMNPRWDPVLEDLSQLLTALEGQRGSFLTPTTLSSRGTASEKPLAVRKSSTSPVFSPTRLAQTQKLARKNALVQNVNLAPTKGNSSTMETARAVSLGWRPSPTAVSTHVASSLASADAFLNEITLETPGTITLSSDKGSFPLTIRNGTDSPVRVSVRLTADVPGISFAKSPAVRIEPGSSHTMTVDANMREQVAATASAQLTTVDGESFGAAQAFVLRTSNVGQYVWIGLGAAVLLVITAAGRRLVQRRRSARVHSTAAHSTAEENGTPHG